MADTVVGVREQVSPSSCNWYHPQVELQVTGIRAVSRAAVLPFELVDAARSEVRDWRKGWEDGCMA